MIEIKFEGGAEMARNLATLTARVTRKMVRENLVEAGQPMRRLMGVLAPVDPTSDRHLKDQMAISNAVYEEDVAVAIGPAKKSYYGSFQELGTAFHGAQPFARPALDQTVMETLKRFAAAMWRELAGRGFSRTVNAPTSVIPGPGGRFGASPRGRGAITAPSSGPGGGRFL